MEFPEGLSQYLREHRRPGKPGRVLMLTRGRWPEGECLRAFRGLGLAVRELSLSDPQDGDPGARLVRCLREFRPDFLFCVNLAGLDPEGRLLAFLGEAHLPCAAWFVEPPEFFLRASPRNVSGWLAGFVADAHFLPTLGELGVAHQAYLPLGADIHIFRPYRHPPVDRFGCPPAAFVGSSWTDKVCHCLAPFVGRPALRAYLEAAARTYQWSSHYDARLALAEVMPQFHELPLWEQLRLEEAVVWLAAQLDRLERVSALVQAGLRVYGDAGWAELLPDPSAYGGPIGSLPELAAFYQCVGVNLNVTGLMNKNGLNRRVFEIPAAGAFLLTEHREALWELFAPDEVVTYRTLEEARDKMLHFQKYPEARRQIAIRARERVVSHHTYGHRMQDVVKWLERWYA